MQVDGHSGMYMTVVHKHRDAEKKLIIINVRSGRSGSGALRMTVSY